MSGPEQSVPPAPELSKCEPRWLRIWSRSSNEEILKEEWNPADNQMDEQENTTTPDKLFVLQTTSTRGAKWSVKVCNWEGARHTKKGEKLLREGTETTPFFYPLSPTFIMVSFL